MERVAVVGLDLAKNVLQVHGVAADGTVVVKRQRRRSQVLSAD
jgi:transposase